MRVLFWGAEDAAKGGDVLVVPCVAVGQLQANSVRGGRGDSHGDSRNGSKGDGSKDSRRV